mmetsp:Transcript_30520/g.68438  ORF Transcript_30520/g.68438 Transcript_30520/m.68438 type:complete len:412 (-) Transcript_30520:288-1523(-)
MDAAYLKKTVGQPLTNALTSMVTDQPRDPVEYIGQYLIRYADREEGKNKTAELFAKAARLAEEKDEAVAKAEAEAKAAEEAKSAALPGEEELLAELRSTREVPDLYPRFLEMCKLATGATSAYIGVKQMSEAGPDGEPPSLPVITYIAGSEGSEIEGQAMTGGDPENEEGPPPEGITFGLFKGTEPPENPDADPEGEEGEAPLIYPTELIVPNVVRHQGMKFFGVPKIGAYLAVPIKYKSCLHADGIGEPSGEPPAEGAKPGKEPVYHQVEMVLGLHTMGQAGRQFTEGEVAKAKRLALEVAEALARAELTVWATEVEAKEVEAEKESDVSEAVAQAKAIAEAEADAAVAALPEDMPDYDKELETKIQVVAATLWARVGLRGWLMKWFVGVHAKRTGAQATRRNKKSVKCG